MRYLALLVMLPCLVRGAADRVTVVGKVVDADGGPMERATVKVYSARARSGYDLFCPTCYVDCAKRTLTSADGSYSITGLNPDLVFNLLVLRDGYEALMVRGVDPATGPAKTMVLKKRTPPADPARCVRGRVVDATGDPVPDALVEGEAIFFPDGRQTYGSFGWTDLLAAANDLGEFEIASKEPASAMILKVSARGKASQLVKLPTGAVRQGVTLTLGATVQGRLTQDGKPVAGAQVAIRTYANASGQALPEVRIGTDENGHFAFTNVPPARVWSVYAPMDYLAGQGLASEVALCATKYDGQKVNVGDLAAKPAFTVRGRIVLGDGKPIPADMRVMIIDGRVSDSQWAPLPADGAFEFKGLARGVYYILPAVKGYQLPGPGSSLEFLAEGDTSGLTLTLQPEPTN